MELQTLLLAIFSSSVVSTLINQLFTRLDQKNRRNKIDRLLLLDALKRQGVEYLNANKISSKDLQSFEEYYKWYKECGGDGFADNIHRRVERLPISDD